MQQSGAMVLASVEAAFQAAFTVINSRYITGSVDKMKAATKIWFHANTLVLYFT